MARQILDFLRAKDGFVSGEDISRELSISRAAVWKHIANLRSIGYSIEAVPHLGYKLLSIPDKLLPEEVSHNLKTKIVGKNIFYYETVTSTMDMAFDLGFNAAPEGTVIFAEHQTNGRGRLGRSWLSPKGKGLYMSLLLRPKFLPQEAPKLTLMAAVSIVEAIKAQTGISAFIKWPNDILIENKKVAGILTEIDSEPDRIKFVNIGIGVNINSIRSLLPDAATSLSAESKKSVCRLELTKDILRFIEKNYLILINDGFDSIREKWKASSSILGRRIKLNYQNREVSGEAQDIDMDGALLLRRDSGFIERVLSGDVIKVN
ncbi:MAG: biotin--[acetyl-CoA-carboxylase] ligase [Candidatus Omnitrophica bacterium CG11_big_fil_rev_8_21_14_0_20_42_13]|uniref:Bifunctional ligase/repressor BirA n=1 Tax=Candidatus Ghiorseimicrobium undicola TaxID=1974746 RepID=A0A2H0LWZ0_9BACT|nr:MAG: biotin--[acetyl-CoA-carboxylase] ligase [Candidatus Omnitrophica bacterium CG11_big_fil_rev_8_21_14_0_20_42_13]